MTAAAQMAWAGNGSSFKATMSRMPNRPGLTAKEIFPRMVCPGGDAVSSWGCESVACLVPLPACPYSGHAGAPGCCVSPKLPQPPLRISFDVPDSELGRVKTGLPLRG